MSIHESRKEELLDSLPEAFTAGAYGTGDARSWDDVRKMKEQFEGFDSIDWDARYGEYIRKKSYGEPGGRKWAKELLPNIIIHENDPSDPAMSAGGTDWLAVGPPGTGKSNAALWLAGRLMEANDEAVVWRGSPSRSEWLPFHRYARVCLPEGIDVSARFEPTNPTDEAVEVDIEDVVREVVRYEDPKHLNQELIEPNVFHVVYPDPKMRGLQDIYEDAGQKQYDELEFSEDDPLGHWWFGWVLARIEEGPYHWKSLILDEIGDIAPQAARKDDYATYQKIELFRDALVDARKKNLSLFMFGHSEEDIHAMIRRKIRWRVTMAKKANPTSNGEVVGFNQVPMNDPFMARYDVGRFLPWNESEFQYPPPKIPYFPSPVDHSLKLTYRGEA